jgi:hypothetical protein
MWSMYCLNFRHPVTKSFTTLHYACRHFTSSHINFTQPHIATLSFGLTPFKFPASSLHLTSLHCTFRWFSPHSYSFHFTPFIIAFLTLFLKILSLQGKVPNAYACSFVTYILFIYWYIVKQFSSEVTEGFSRQIPEPAVAYQLLCICQRTRMPLTLSHFCTWTGVRTEWRLWKSVVSGTGR